MKLREHPEIASGWATLSWNSAHSYGRGDRFSNQPAGSEGGILREVHLEPSPSNELRLVREYSGERQTAFIELNDPFRTKLHELLKRFIDKPIVEIGSLSVDAELNSR